MQRLFQSRHSGNFSSGSTALPLSWKCIIATGLTCSLWGTDQSWNFCNSGKYQQIQASGKRFQHMLQGCKNIFARLQITVLVNPCKMNTTNKKIRQTSSGYIYAGRTCSVNFSNRDFSTSPWTQCPSKHCFCFYLPSTKPKSTQGTSAPYCCCSFPVPTSLPVFQDSVDTLVSPSSAPPSATNRPYPCSSPALIQCMFYSH